MHGQGSLLYMYARPGPQWRFPCKTVWCDSQKGRVDGHASDRFRHPRGQPLSAAPHVIGLVQAR
eukprot:5254848-Prymnesium_polylepis.1